MEEKERIIGKFNAHEKGFGFVEVEGEEKKPDIFIPAKSINGALNEDIVEVEIVNESGKSKEGKIIRIVRRGKDTLVGTFQNSKNFGFVIPDDKKLTQDIFIPEKDSMGAVTGHKVVVEIRKYGDEERKPEGVILEILGHINDPGVDILSIIKQYDLPVDFPEDVYKQIKKTQ